MSDQEATTSSSYVLRLGSLSGEIGDGLGKPMAIVGCERPDPQPFSLAVSDRRFGVLKTLLKRVEKDSVWAGIW